VFGLSADTADDLHVAERLVRKNEVDEASFPLSTPFDELSESLLFPDVASSSVVSTPQALRAANAIVVDLTKGFFGN
jgi:hypothetical protein